MAIRTILLAGLLGLAALAAFSAEDKAVPSKPRTPVLVELFTSEGCSSCPPADALLIELDQKQSVPEAEIITLGEHVDYWNSLGWRDRFSSAQFSQRQQDYASRFGLNSVYTPQMVVDGRAEFVGNDPRRARQAIAEAVRSPKPARITIARTGSDSLEVRVEDAGRGAAEVVLAITENGLSTAVARGENEGRVLRHTAVVRQWRVLGKVKDGRFASSARVTFNPEWRHENLKAVAFVQDASSREIRGAAAVPLK